MSVFVRTLEWQSGRVPIGYLGQPIGMQRLRKGQILIQGHTESN